MSKIVILAATALVLVGCQQSVDQQFRIMCEDQKRSDPTAWASSEKACRYADDLTDDQKSIMLDAYEELKRAREAVEH